MRALLGGLAIVACKSAAAPPEIKTSSVDVKGASEPSLVVEPPKEAAGAMVEAPLFLAMRNVDWSNHDYGSWVGRLDDGHSQSREYEASAGAYNSIATTFITVAYGDLDGDRKEEAITERETVSRR